MYETESNTKRHFVIFAALASLVAWAFILYFKPLIVETSCSSVAAASTNLFGTKRQKIDPNLTYENTKSRCMEDALKGAD